MAEQAALAPPATGPASPARSGAPGPDPDARPASPPAGSRRRTARWVAGNLLFGYAWFVVVVFGLGSAVFAFPLGIPVAGATLLVIRLGAVLERERAERAFGERLEPCERPLPPHGLWRRVRTAASDGVVWRDAAYLGLFGPLALLSIVAATLWVALAVAGLTALVWLPGLDVDLAGVDVSSVPAALVLTLGGVGAAVALRRLPSLLVTPARWVLRSLLGPDVERLRQRADELAARSTLVAQVAAAERRRLERDLHDGAQQRLVSAGLTLGMLVERLRSEHASDGALALATDAHASVRASIAELRALAQGIHPLGLVEGGLPEALDQLAGRSALPVHLLVRLDGRPDADVERTAYFVAAEAVTNATRHSGAASVDVEATRRDDRLVLRITDAGHGGALVVPSGGLGGLADRVRTVGGTLTVTSPPGEGTVVEADLPWTTSV